MQEFLIWVDFGRCCIVSFFLSKFIFFFYFLLFYSSFLFSISSSFFYFDVQLRLRLLTVFFFVPKLFLFFVIFIFPVVVDDLLLMLLKCGGLFGNKIEQKKKKTNGNKIGTKIKMEIGERGTKKRVWRKSRKKTKKWIYDCKSFVFCFFSYSIIQQPKITDNEVLLFYFSYLCFFFFNKQMDRFCCFRLNLDNEKFLLS